VVIVDNLRNASTIAVDRVGAVTGVDVPLEVVDVRDTDALRSVVATSFGGGGVDAVIHFAGRKAVGESVAQPIRYYDDNVAGTVSLLEVMDEAGVHVLVFSSSATVYGAPEEMPIREDAPLGAVNPYGRTKQHIEAMLDDVARSDPTWRIASLRYFNPVGAHESGQLGEDPTGVPMNLLPFLTQVAVGRQPELVIHGDDYPTPDGTCIRDYVHVMDIAAGHTLVLDALRDRAGAHAWNLGTGRGSSVREVVDAFESTIGRELPKRVGPRRPGDAPVSYCDPSRAAADFGWTAKRGLDDMCRDAWRWQSQNPDGFRVSS
jgi:UDP-glucose 4-epimerase